MAEENLSEPKADETPAEKKSTKPGISHFHRFKAWYVQRKKWTIPASVLGLIMLLAIIPLTRYSLTGLVIKKNFTVKVLDSETNTPVSGADVTTQSKVVQTDSAGEAHFKGLKPGSHKVAVHKNYYTDDTFSPTVPLLSQKNPATLKLVATGRQTKITVKNLISQAALSNVTIKVSDITAKTDKNGQAIIVLPTGTTSAKADLSLDKYNPATVTIKVSDTTIENNQLTMTPAGKVYFLSKLSGKIDVVKTNLDGSERATVLAGTGNEDDTGTVLLASRDWKYLALLSRRAGNYDTLYLIDTSDDSLSTIDEGTASFNLVGWSDDNFIYTVSRQNLQPWQPHGQALKSFNAPSGKLATLDQTNAIGDSSYNFAHEIYGSIYEIGNKIIYSKDWSYYYQFYAHSQNAGIYSINADGSNPQTLKTFGYDDTNSTNISSLAYEADQVYFSVFEKGNQTYYVYANGKLTTNSSIAQKFNNYQQPAAYLLSPSGNNTFWAEPRDGKNTIFIGDSSGEGGKQIASLSDYNPYGWYSDNYLLVSKNGSELYAMSKDGKNVTKITDYHKPAQSYNGYGGGYGGV